MHGAVLILPMALKNTINNIDMQLNRKQQCIVQS